MAQGTEDYTPDLLTIGRSWWVRVNNDRTWKDGKGHEHQIARMEPSHRANLRRWLRRRATAISHVVGLYELQRIPDPSECSDGLLDMALSAIEELGQRDPYVWITTTPLFMALVAVDNPHVP